MSWFPGARHRPVQGHTNGPVREWLGVALHVNDSVGNLYNWVRGNHDMSCHFEVYRDGSIEQYLSTAVSSWCQKGGNNTYISIETEGYPRTGLTPKQLESVARIMAWLHREHGIPLRVVNHAGERGLITHGLGVPVWGGNHSGCPGKKRTAQRAQIIGRAIALTGEPHPPATPEPRPHEHAPVMPAWPWRSPRIYLGPITGPAISRGGGAPGDRRMVAALQAALEYVTGHHIEDVRGKFRGDTAAALAAFQRTHGMRVRPKLYRGGWAKLRAAAVQKEKHR